MKLRVFKAGDGDCLLVHGADANILVDGGRKKPFVDHVAPALEELQADGQVLDLVCVSHIDDDHITGVVELYRRRTEWAAHRAMPGSRQPRFPEPPTIKRLWHNAFEATVAGDAGGGRITNQLGFHDQILTAINALSESKRYGQSFGKITQGARLAIELDLRFQQSPMGIEFNGPTNGDLIQVEDQPLVVEINGLNVRILSPVKEDLDRLRSDWDRWVRNNEAKIEEMKEKFLLQSGSTNALEFLRFAADAAADGSFDDVTPPNLASITFLLEEQGQTILMTGDHASQGEGVDSSKQGLLEGLERAALLPPSGGLHVNVLKAPHHGALANLSREFVKRVTADHYVFCANGRHHNPELDVVEAYVQSRLGSDDQRSENAEADRRFKLWFNYAPEDVEIAHNANFVKQMRKVKAKVEQLAGGDLFDFEFCSDGSFTIDLD